MANQRVKEFEAKQKAERKAAKLAKKNSDDPRDWGTLRQIRESWKIGVQYDKKLAGWVISAGLTVFVICVAIGVVLATQTGSVASWIWGIIFGITLGLMAAMLVFTNRLKKVTYIRYGDQPGAGEVALQMLPKKKFSYSAAIAFNRQQDTVHRVVGPSGLILIGDGNPVRTRQLLNTEARRHRAIVTYNVEVETLMIGDGEDEIALNQLANHIKKMPKVLDKNQIAELGSRLKALDASKSKLPLPKGPLPSVKGSRRAMRGR